MKKLENKGMNWSDNIYYKFEGIIPDVNDMMIQDTFKYVESRVNNVGGNFKKFCSDVVQDFFPLSSDLEKQVAPEESSAMVSTDDCGSSEISVREAASDSAVKQSQVALATEAVDHVDEQRGLGDELENAKFVEGNEVQDSISPTRMNELANENSDLSNKDVGKTEEPLLGASSLDELIGTNHEENSVVLSNVGLETSPLGLVSKGALCDDTECDIYAPISIPENYCADVSGEEASISTWSSPLRDFTSPPRSSCDISSPEMYCHICDDLAGCATNSASELHFPTPASAMRVKDGVNEMQLVSSISHLSLESFGCIDDSGVDVADCLGMETISLHDEVNLGESCVFVDDSALYAVSRRARKIGSYKKKIQDIFASKKRLAKEYEQLAIWYGDTDIDFSPDIQARQSCDSEWELL